MIELNDIFSVIPFSTFSIVIVIMAFRYDLWIDMVEMNASYFGISSQLMIVLAVIAAFVIMILAAGIWKLIKYYQEQRQAQLEHQRILADERQALIALFNSLNGSHWLDKTRWCSNEPVDTWKGVKVNRSGRVRKLILNDNNLTGNSIIYNLSAIVYLNFHLIRDYSRSYRGLS